MMGGEAATCMRCFPFACPPHNSSFSCESSLCGHHAKRDTFTRAQYVNNNENGKSIVAHIYESMATRGGRLVKKRRLSKAKVLYHSAKNGVADALKVA